MIRVPSLARALSLALLVLMTTAIGSARAQNPPRHPVLPIR